MRKQSNKPHPKAKRKAEKWFHKWIVIRDKRICYTCGKEGNQAGHFKHGRLDFDENNLHCQCAYCNKWLHGALGIYAIKLLDELGRKKFDKLVFRANTENNKYTIAELEEIADYYQAQCLSLQKYSKVVII